MKRHKLLCLLVALGLIAAACGRSSSDKAAEPSGGGTATTAAANAKCSGVTLEATDTGVTADTVNKLQAIATSVDGVRSLHDIRTRYVGGSSIHVDLHVVVNPDMTVMESHHIGDEVAARLKAEGPDVLDVLVHIDPGPDM